TVVPGVYLKKITPRVIVGRTSCPLLPVGRKSLPHGTIDTLEYSHCFHIVVAEFPAIIETELVHQVFVKLYCPPGRSNRLGTYLAGRRNVLESCPVAY